MTVIFQGIHDMTPRHTSALSKLSLCNENHRESVIFITASDASL